MPLARANFFDGDHISDAPRLNDGARLYFISVFITIYNK